MSGYFSADVALTGRHARFSAAVGELSYESGLSVEARLGAVGELVRLADEWLADVSVSEGACHREAQDIVSALCAYVSTPFPLASRAELYGEVPPNLDQQETLQFHRDKKALTEESRVRVRILEEIHTRVRWKPAGGATKKKESQQVAAGEITPGPWSGFYFEFFDSASFSSAEFFFPVDFSGSYWGEGLYCPGAFFAQSVTFSNSFYGGNVSFIGTHCQGIADFSGCTYAANADFGVTRYMSPVTFSECIYRGEANFNENQYGERADFSGSTFGKEAVFADSVYSTKTVFSYSVFSAATDFSNIVLAGSSPSFKKFVFAVGKNPARREFKRA